ncbi:glycoside hydrolase family 97 N-terminal domain-containing protein, partial [Roseateles cellulosilyticus]
MKTSTPIRLAAAALMLAANCSQADTLLASPDGQIALHIADDGASYRITRHGEAVIASSPLGLELDGQSALGPLTLASREDVQQDRTIPLIATKAAQARDHYRGTTLTFQEAGTGRRFIIDARAYDEGVAFRYRLEGAGPVRLRNERTAFVPAGDPACLVTPVDGGHEAQFERRRVSELPADAAFDVPVVCGTPSGRTHYAITQAHLQGYTGASLRREGAALRLHLSGVPGRTGPALVSASGLTTAWRVVMMA